MSNITPQDVAAKVEDIRQMAGDDERAHSMEDDLHQSVLAAIRDGTCDDPKRCAALALETLEIDFARWCA